MVEFVNQLLRRNPKTRLGAFGAKELKSHLLFHDYDWSSLERKKTVAPFKPKIKPRLRKPKERPR